MRRYPSDVAFTPAVKAIQEREGSRWGYARMEQKGGWQTTISGDLEGFLADLDMFYLGTASADGRPYIQYRGGPPGFLKALDETTLAFADFGGNRQYITLGNLSENPKAFLFLMEYANQRRVKLWGAARVIEGDDALLGRLSDPNYPGKVERAIVFTVEAWDVNCPQHIHPRYTERQIRPVVDRLQQRIDELEQEVAKLRAERAPLEVRLEEPHEIDAPRRSPPGCGPTERWISCRDRIGRTIHRVAPNGRLGSPPGVAQWHFSSRMT